MPPPALIVAGPTASGKSALALELAERLRGTIINADAMQVYRELRILTARPSAAGRSPRPARACMASVRRRSQAASRGGARRRWRRWSGARGAGRLPILTGGTGLYFAALTDGLAAIPDPGPAARDEARRLLKEIGPAALHARLAEADPDTAVRIRPTDSQRVARAWEVWRGTGREPRVVAVSRRPAGTLAVRRHPARSPADRAARRRSRPGSRRCCGEDAIEEVRALLALDLDPALPAMRAHGVPELAGYLRGDLTLDDGHAADRTGHRPVHQAAGDLVPPSSTCRTAARAYDPCAIYRIRSNFRKAITQISCAFIESLG